ncbi:Ig-like domain-containing protein, partial [Bacillus thuringiensis]|nr:Ig-like domain-containing protein [Bacillus thuringiensis]
IPKQAVGTKLSVTASNNAGTSAGTEVTVKETVPSAPKVNEVKETDEKVTGTTKPGSTVTVKVGTQELGKGTADETGKFSVVIPKQAVGTKLSVTASNNAGTSAGTEVTVKE